MGIEMNWISLLHGPDDIVEIRSVDPKPVVSGYFKASSPNIASELAKFPNRTFYQTMNFIQPACYSRGQHERLIERPKETTSDNDILGYQWILVDADPVRPSGVSASKEEKEAARQVVGTAMKKLMAMGFSEPVVADSGNGYHLLFKVHASLDERQVIADFLSVLDMWFSTDSAKVDTAVFNPARITKLYGTVARKGANTSDRSHRRSTIISYPMEIQETPMALIRHVAKECQHKVPAAENPVPRTNTAFDLEKYLAEKGVQVAKRIQIGTGSKYQLVECPFDSSHRNGDAAVFAFNNGSYGFHCFHNSCSGNHWHEFREKIDPQAYANSPYTVHQAVTMGRPMPDGSKPSSHPAAISKGQPQMLNFPTIPNHDRSKIVVIRSRLSTLDGLIGGFNKSELTVWTGGNASGKSTIVSQLGLAAITEGFKVAMFSGEMTASRVREWVLLQAAGPENVQQDLLNRNHYCLKPGVEATLDAMLDGKLSIYDNDFGTDWEVVLKTIKDWVIANGASVVIIDNLMALDIPVTNDKNDMQSRIVKRFSAMAKELNVHVHFICHPRKTDSFLRKGDISGTADITNVADNVIIVHRRDVDFNIKYRTVYPKLEIPAEVGNVLEIVKNRDLGVVNEMVLLYFDKQTKTMTDIKGMPPQHAWSEQIRQPAMAGFGNGCNPDSPVEWG